MKDYVNANVINNVHNVLKQNIYITENLILEVLFFFIL